MAAASVKVVSKEGGGHDERDIRKRRCVYRHSLTWTKNRLSVEAIRVRSSHSEDGEILNPFAHSSR